MNQYKHFLLWMFYFIPIVLFQIIYITTKMEYFGWVIVVYPMMILIGILFAKDEESKKR